MKTKVEENSKQMKHEVASQIIASQYRKTRKPFPEAVTSERSGSNNLLSSAHKSQKFTALPTSDM
jgi:hypothetical protein